ncbi:MAG: L,D-transpeptidase [Bacteroidetes bacterium]|nr:L,D-transpeptidase [Bacteroidota bacterium]
MAACAGSKKQTAFGDFQYNQFKDSLLQTETNRQADTTNIFDSKSFIPDVHSLDTLLVRIDTFWQQEEAHLMAHLDSLKKGLAKDPGFSAADKAIISENIKAVDSFLMTKDSARTSACTIGDCILYVVIDKSKQVLYLYILGELKDSFLVSTGSGKKYETPEMELHPQGPVLTRYTSRKFPGGNYQGMGNMPYAVFLKNGYAIHGTTPGNYSKLGTRASHGCIRLHPDNAKLFNTLVKTVGLEQTWVSVRDSLR